jgi:hypothetical protein
VPEVFEVWMAQKAVVDAYGLKLVAYEGGQHAHHTFRLADEVKIYLKTLDEFMRDFVKSPQMADLYEEMWSAWSQVGDGPFMQYGAVEAASRSGSWGLREWIGDENPRAVALDTLNASETPWWDAEADEAYGQGVTERGTDGNDVLAGTRAEDTLIGGMGDDILIGGLGDDRIHGGKGSDVLVLNGNATDYNMAFDGDALMLIGADGADRVVVVEFFAFEDGTLSIEAPQAQAVAGTEESATGQPLLIIRGWSDGLDSQEAMAEFAVKSGSDANDHIEGSGEGDWLRGGAGNDRLRGFKGDDVLEGGDGGDTLFGGAGADTFVFGKGDGKRDWIADYEAGDVIDLRGLGLAKDTVATDLAVELEHGRLMLDWGYGEVVLLNFGMEDVGQVDLLL